MATVANSTLSNSTTTTPVNVNLAATAKYNKKNMRGAASVNFNSNNNHLSSSSIIFPVTNSGYGLPPSGASAAAAVSSSSIQQRSSSSLARSTAPSRRHASSLPPQVPISYKEITAQGCTTSDLMLHQKYPPQYHPNAHRLAPHLLPSTHPLINNNGDGEETEVCMPSGLTRRMSLVEKSLKHPLDDVGVNHGPKQYARRGSVPVNISNAIETQENPRKKARKAPIPPRLTIVPGAETRRALPEGAVVARSCGNERTPSDESVMRFKSAFETLLSVSSRRRKSIPDLMILDATLISPRTKSPMELPSPSVSQPLSATLPPAYQLANLPLWHDITADADAPISACSLNATIDAARASLNLSTSGSPMLSARTEVSRPSSPQSVEANPVPSKPLPKPNSSCLPPESTKDDERSSEKQVSKASFAPTPATGPTKDVNAENEQENTAVTEGLDIIGSGGILPLWNDTSDFWPSGGLSSADIYALVNNFTYSQATMAATSSLGQRSPYGSFQDDINLQDLNDYFQDSPAQAVSSVGVSANVPSPLSHTDMHTSGFVSMMGSGMAESAVISSDGSLITPPRFYNESSEAQFPEMKGAIPRSNPEVNAGADTNFTSPPLSPSLQQ